MPYQPIENHGIIGNMRTFFEKLWWYDQVVFDASLCRARKEET